MQKLPCWILPRRLDLPPSRQARFVLVGLHALALTGIAVASVQSWGGWVFLLATGATVASLIYSLQAFRVLRICLYADGTLQLFDPVRGWLPAQILPGVVVWLNLAIARFSVRRPDCRHAQVYYVLALHDNLSPADFRLLRVWLRRVVPSSADEPS